MSISSEDRKDLYTFDDYLDGFSDLPNRFINKDILVSENAQFIIDYYLDLYSVLSFRIDLRLKYGFKRNKKVFFSFDPHFSKSYVDLSRSDYVKNLSELYVIEYKLIRELWKLCNENNIKLPEEFRSPKHWWYLIRYEECFEALLDKGIFGGNSKTIGKTDGKKQIETKYFDKYFPEGKIQLDKILIEKGKPMHGASGAMETYIIKLLKFLSDNGKTIRLNSLHEELLETNRSLNSSIEEDPKLKKILHNEEIFKVLGKKIRIPKEFKY